MAWKYLSAGACKAGGPLCSPHCPTPCPTPRVAHVETAVDAKPLQAQTIPQQIRGTCSQPMPLLGATSLLLLRNVNIKESSDTSGLYLRERSEEKIF